MAEILFYHLTESKLDDALPGLVERSVERGWRVAVQATTQERRDTIDALLWSWSDVSFIAHGSDQEPYVEEQPVLLTITQNNLNQATVRFLVEGADIDNATDYERLVVMFDGHDTEQVNLARAQWKKFKQDDHNLTYWQQNSDRRWERKA